MASLEELKQKREMLTTRIFWVAFEIIFIFGVPAGIGAYVGKVILGGGAPLLFILIGTFIFSWLIVIKRYQMISRKIEAIDEQIRKAEAELSSDTE